MLSNKNVNMFVEYFKVRLKPDSHCPVLFRVRQAWRVAP
jgi:hypothetical protein